MSGSIFGKYQLLAQLGEGGMAQVFLAVHAGPRGSGFSKLTVIKKLRASYEEDGTFINMLVEEASLAARLNHPNVVQTHEVGDVEGKYFLSMEYLDGQSLHRTQNRSKTRQQAAQLDEAKPGSPFTPEMEYVVLLDVLAGLHHAHELADYDGTPFAIVHRDVTPHNVFITYEGQVKIVDFGIAKAAGRGTETRHGEIKGKMRYMAPEQAMGKAVDRRADIFSVGVALWEAATGQRRWKDEPEAAIVRALISGEAYISPRTIDPTIAPEIEAMCKKALASDPADRFQTAEEFRLELQGYLASTGKLVDSRAQLGPAISSLFADKRAELKAVIEKRLSTVGSSTDQAPMMLTLHGAGDGSSRRLLAAGSSSFSATVDSSAIGSGTAASGTGMQAQVPPRSSKAPMVVGAAALAGALAVAAFLFLRAPPAAPITTTTAAVNAPPVVAETVSPQVSVSISAAPPSAKISVDGKEVFAPYEAKLERSSAPHVLRVDAEGFESQTRSVVFDRDVSIAVALNKAPVAERPAAARVAPAAAFGFQPRPAAPKRPEVEAPAPPPPAASTPSTAAVATAKPKKDIDRGNPFPQGGGPAKSIDKTSPFNR